MGIESSAQAAGCPLSLALQGGGAHGAHAWGVLDRLLEDGWVCFDGVSGTRAGAMNAVVLAQGLMEGGRDGARAAWRASGPGGIRRPRAGGGGWCAFPGFFQFAARTGFAGANVSALMQFQCNLQVMGRQNRPGRLRDLPHGEPP